MATSLLGTLLVAVRWLYSTFIKKSRFDFQYIRFECYMQISINTWYLCFVDTFGIATENSKQSICEEYFPHIYMNHLLTYGVTCTFCI